MEGNISVKDTSVNLQETFLDLYKQQKLRKYQKCQSNHNTVGISQYNPIQLAKYCNLIGWSRATELDYIVKCLQCDVEGVNCFYVVCHGFQRHIVDINANR